MANANTTKRLYGVAIIGFTLGAVAWGAAGFVDDNLVYGLMGISSFCLGAMFFAFGRGVTEEDSSGPSA